MPTPVIVETYNLSNNNPKLDADGNEIPENTRRIDHDDPLHRKWLGSHCFWALRNNREVRTLPVEAV